MTATKLTTGRTAASGTTTGVWLGLLAAALFGTSGVVAKPLLEAGWSSGSVVLLRLGGATLVLTAPAVMLLRGRWGLLRANAGFILIYGVVAMAGCQVFYFNAVSRLSVGVALLLEYLGLVLVVGWLWFRHGQRPRSWTVAGVALAILGLVLVLDLGGARLDPVGVLWGLAAAVGLAIFFVLSARSDTGLRPIALAWSGMVVSTVALAVAAATGLMPVEAGSGPVGFLGATVHWLVPAAWLAIIAAAFSYGAGIEATRRLGSKLSSFLGLTEVLFAVVFAWLALGEMLLPAQMAGGALIVAGVAAVRYDEGRPQRRRSAGGLAPAAPLTPVGAVARAHWSDPGEISHDRI